MSFWTKRITIGKEINLVPVVIQARAILAVPDTSSRKSEWRVIADHNKEALCNPDMEPRLFLECEYVAKYWGNGPKTMVIDVETNDVYRNISGSARENGKYIHRQYLKKVDDPEHLASELTNYKDVLDRVMNKEGE